MIDDLLHAPLWAFFEPYTWIDGAIVLILLISVTFGWIRGMVYEFFSLASWLVAFWVARTWSGAVARYLAPWVSHDLLRWGLSFILLMIAVLITMRLLSNLARQIINKIGLRSLDGLLGAIFGLLRGVLILLVLLLLAGLTPLPQDVSWKQAKLLPYAMRGVRMALAWLPPTLTRPLHYSVNGVDQPPETLL